MTVAELIAKLGEFPQDMLVVVSGFDEAGYAVLDCIEVVRIAAAGDNLFCDEDEHTHRDLGSPFDALHLDF